MSYTKRNVELKTVAEIDDGVIGWTDGWHFGGNPPETLERIEVGEFYLVETQGFSKVTGLATVFLDAFGAAVVDEWLWHKTDADLEEEHRQFVEDMNRRNQERVDARREEWLAQEAELPTPLRERLQRFREKGGDAFDRDGWGYELVISRLAVLYHASGGEDDEDVMEFSRKEGTSGNQHGFAKMLAKGLGDEEYEALIADESVSALSPLTGDPDYSKAGEL